VALLPIQHSGALATLAGTDDEDLSIALEPITARWPVDEIGKTVTALSARQSEDPSHALLRSEPPRRWAESDPVAAAAFAANETEPGPAQERAVAAIVQRWAQQDPDAVRAWIEEFPDGSLTYNALGHLAAATASVEESTEAR
jgi:RecB family exonuclease